MKLIKKKDVKLITIIIILTSLLLLKQTQQAQAQDKKQKDKQPSSNSPTLELDDPLDKIKSKFTKDWDNKLNDFSPEHFYNFDLPGRKKISFVEYFENTPVEVQGAFLTSENEKDKIYFYVKQENGAIVFHETNNESVFKFRIKAKGKYSFILENRYSDNMFTVTFTMGTKQNQILTSNQLEITNSKITKLDNFMKSVYVDQEFMRNKFKERVKRKIYKYNELYIY